MLENAFLNMIVDFLKMIVEILTSDDNSFFCLLRTHGLSKNIVLLHIFKVPLTPLECTPLYTNNRSRSFHDLFRYVCSTSLYTQHRIRHYLHSLLYLVYVNGIY